MVNGCVCLRHFLPVINVLLLLPCPVNSSPTPPSQNICIELTLAHQPPPVSWDPQGAGDVANLTFPEQSVSAPHFLFPPLHLASRCLWGILIPTTPTLPLNPSPCTGLVPSTALLSSIELQPLQDTCSVLPAPCSRTSC